MVRRGSAEPILVFGPRSTDYDFGPYHPLTPRRFGPGIDMLQALGAVPGLAPEPASDEELLACHTAEYIETVRRCSADPTRPSERGIGPGDTPAFHGMHEAGAAVVGGSLRAVEAILRGEVEHAYHPGGGLHHAMPGRASGFCIYDDPALAIARARQAGLRVLYVDLDVHHGDGVQEIHATDAGVLTFSIHESGQTLFPGTGFVNELGLGVAAGTAANVPLAAGTGESVWLGAIEAVLPQLTAAFGPDLIVSQHGADAHAWDPLANLRVTTTAMGRAARLVDRLAHRHAEGRWLATGGGGYDVYRVVPRAWALTWLAGAHRETPDATPAAWRDRWAAEADRLDGGPLPVRFDDSPNAGLSFSPAQEAAEARSMATAALVRSVVVPRLLREADAQGWWNASDGPTAPPASERAAWSRVDPPRYAPAVLERLEPHVAERLTLAPRVIAPLDPAAGLGLLRAAVGAPGVKVTAAVDATTIVGLVVSVLPPDRPGVREIVAIGVAPGARRAGLAGRLIDAHRSTLRPGDESIELHVTVAERDVIDPLPGETRREVARGLARRFGLSTVDPPPDVGRVDPLALSAVGR
jgi:acetoin utilization protein AcuC